MSLAKVTDNTILGINRSWSANYNYTLQSMKMTPETPRKMYDGER